MKINVKCYATLNTYTPENESLELEEAATARDVLDKLDLEEKDVKLVFKNGKHISLSTKLEEGDKLGIFPAVGGG